MNRLDIFRTGPYRLFFPLAILCGVVAVGHWTLWSIGWKEDGSILFHAVLQSEGFLGAVAVGFLMTFLPRAMGTEEASLTEVLLGFCFSFLILIFILTNVVWAAHISFLALNVNLIVFAARRYKNKTKDPPASLVLLDVGILHAVLGTCFMLIGYKSYFTIGIIGHHMVQIGFLLCLVLAMTGMLAPFLMGYMNEDPTPTTRMPAHAIIGLMILASFIAEPWFPQMSAGARAVLVTFHLFKFARVARKSKKHNIQIRLFHLACWMIPLGLWISFLFPRYRVAGLHVTFIGGFTLLIFSFGTIIVLTHSAKAMLLNKPIIPLWVIGPIVLIAVALRVLSDVRPDYYFEFIHSSSGLWVLAAIIWLVYIFPKLYIDPIKEAKKKNQSKI